AFITDIFVIMLCLCLGFFIVNLISTNDIKFTSFINYVVFLPAIMLIFILLGLYPGVMISPAELVRKYATGTFFSFALIIFSILYSHTQDWVFMKAIVAYTQDVPLLCAFILAFIFSLFLLPGIRSLARKIFAGYKWYGVPAVVYTTDNAASAVIDKLLSKKYLGYTPCCIIETNVTQDNYKGIPIFSDKDTEILNFIHSYNIKNAVICDYKGDIPEIMNHYRYTISIAKSQNSFTSTQHIKDIDGIIGFASTHNLTFKSNLVIKRMLDIGLILLFSPILIPVFLILMILTKITSKGPIFYGHKRVGKNGKEFKCWKFRSMNIRSQEMLEEILATDPVRRAEWEAERKFKDDPRVTKFGKILRKTSLDELPQLINVLTGQMSFIGPRPVTAPEMEKYGQYKDYVLSVLPGLSGMWQISGRSETSYEERIYYDTYYIQNWSVWLDIWILIKTVGVVLIGKGAY
ncbi:MAG: exopolysaccharide biosynthesis polyprenyl glycosylphosphotransferase, partial [Treponema sp.]|nr:exopolysaccharide biosynthesis polyprenyl glycosylphosphotransferase [Treponema sp.]